jgi:uncharacterized protein YciI
MYLLLVHYLRPLDEVDTQLEAHRAFLDVYFQRGTFVVSGPRDERGLGGVILARAIVEEELQGIIAADPFVRHGLARYEIISFRVTKHAPGFEAYLE